MKVISRWKHLLGMYLNINVVCCVGRVDIQMFRALALRRRGGKNRKKEDCRRWRPTLQTLDFTYRQYTNLFIFQFVFEYTYLSITLLYALGKQVSGLPWKNGVTVYSVRYNIFGELEFWWIQLIDQSPYGWIATFANQSQTGNVPRRSDHICQNHNGVMKTTKMLSRCSSIYFPEKNSSEFWVPIKLW